MGKIQVVFLLIPGVMRGFLVELFWTFRALFEAQENPGNTHYFQVNFQWEILSIYWIHSPSLPFPKYLMKSTQKTIGK
jgi:hypothetical protein